MCKHFTVYRGKCTNTTQTHVRMKRKTIGEKKHILHSFGFLFIVYSI